MDSFTCTLSGNSSILKADYFPPIELRNNRQYVLGLVELITFNSIPNIDERNNKFYVNNKVYSINEGTYELQDLETYLRSLGIEIKMQPNMNTLRCELKCNKEVNFKPADSIGSLLGFLPKRLPANETHYSDKPVKILRFNTVRVICNLTNDSYINNQQCHSIYEFYPTVGKGFKIVQTPSQIIYYRVATRVIDKLELRIVDEEGNLINFRGETITIRLHIKAV